MGLGDVIRAVAWVAGAGLWLGPAQAAPPYSYAWDFGDGSGTVAQQSGVHTYAEPGTYTVTLTVTDVDGTRRTKSGTVVVEPPPNEPPTAAIGLGGPNVGEAPFDVTLSARAEDPEGETLSYAWDLGDGNHAQGAEVGHRYTRAGEYTVTLTVTDPRGASASATQAISVSAANHPPSVVIEASTTRGAAPLRVGLVGSGSDPEGGALTLAWDLGDGTRAEGRIVDHTYTVPGRYAVILTATDEGGATGSARTEIEVADDGAGGLAVTADAAPRSGTAPLEVLFVGDAAGGDGPYAYRWEFGDGAASEQAVPRHSYTEPGRYTATLTVTDIDGTTASATTVIEVGEGDAGGSAGASGGVGQAVVIAGGGAQRGNTLFPVTERLANRFYQVLRARGFGDGDIHYLNPVTWQDVDGDGANDGVVDADLAGGEGDLEAAFAEAAERLEVGEQFVLYFHGHAGPERLALNGEAQVDGATLRRLLEGLPAGVTRVVILDACFSGSLLDDLSGPETVVVTSADAESRAWNSEGLTFTERLLRELHRGESVYGAWSAGERMMAEHPRLFRSQRPWLDDTGDGLYTSGDGVLAERTHLGGEGISAASPPRIGQVHPRLALEEGRASAVLWVKATALEGDVSGVEATLVPPRYTAGDYQQGDAEVGDRLERVELIYNPAQERWEGVYDGFREAGTWEVIYRAQGGGLFSEAVQGEVTAPGVESGVALRVGVNRSHYGYGDPLLFTLTANGEERVDLYAALVFPDGNFITFGYPMTPSFPNAIRPYREEVELSGEEDMTVLDLAIPAGVMKGTYQGCGVATSAGANPWDGQTWLSADCVGFEVR